MEKKIKYVLPFLLFLACCTTKQKTYLNKLPGNWEAITDWASVELEFTELKLRYQDRLRNFSYTCDYQIKGDTLVLFDSARIEKHIISKVSSSELRFQSMDPNQKDVSDIDGLVFKKIVKERQQ